MAKKEEWTEVETVTSKDKENKVEFEVEEELKTEASSDTEPVKEPETKPEEVELETSEPAETEVILTPEAECPGKDTNTIGMGIAEEYEFSSYEQVMTWFCDGAEFEDILVALQTEELSDTPAEEMLVMLAEGFTWEDIWLVVDLIE